MSLLQFLLFLFFIGQIKRHLMNILIKVKRFQKQRLNMFETLLKKMGNICEDDVWENPAMYIVVTCTFDGCSNKIKLMRPGLMMVKNYALLNLKERNEIVQNLSNREKIQRLETLALYQSIQER